MGFFIYVFSPESREQMLSMGYEELDDGSPKNYYIFANKGRYFFSVDFPYVLTDTLII